MSREIAREKGFVCTIVFEMNGNCGFLFPLWLLFVLSPSERITRISDAKAACYIHKLSTVYFNNRGTLAYCPVSVWIDARLFQYSFEQSQEKGIRNSSAEILWSHAKWRLEGTLVLILLFEWRTKNTEIKGEYICRINLVCAKIYVSTSNTVTSWSCRLVIAPPPAGNLDCTLMTKTWCVL